MRDILKIKIDSDKRIYGLDILRALAILFVVFAHSTSFVPKSLKIFYWHLQYDGVSVFFVLSGFLIGKILCMNRTLPNLTI